MGARNLSGEETGISRSGKEGDRFVKGRIWAIYRSCCTFLAVSRENCSRTLFIFSLLLYYQHRVDSARRDRLHGNTRILHNAGAWRDRNWAGIIAELEEAES